MAFSSESNLNLGSTRQSDDPPTTTAVGWGPDQRPVEIELRGLDVARERTFGARPASSNERILSNRLPSGIEIDPVSWGEQPAVRRRPQ